MPKDTKGHGSNAGGRKSLWDSASAKTRERWKAQDSAAAAKRSGPARPTLRELAARAARAKTRK